MKVVDLHPEDLIDKWSAGELTLAESARLDVHLAQCNVCRFEIGVRGEIEQEMPILDHRPQLGLPAASEQLRRSGPAPRRLVSSRPRARRRWLLVMLAAAFVLCAGGATAAVLSGAVQPSWLPWAPPVDGVLETPPSASPKSASKVRHSAPSRAVRAVPQAAASAEASLPSIPPVNSQPLDEQARPSAPAPLSAPVTVRQSRGRKAPPAGGNADAAVAASALQVPPAAPSRADGAPRLDPAAALFADANRARRDGNAARAVSLYRALQNRYPNSAESALSAALLAQLQLDRGSPEAALLGFDRYLAADSPVLSAEALVGRARALEQLGKSAQAAAAWREVQGRFPGSVHARLAATRLAALGMR